MRHGPGRVDPGPPARCMVGGMVRDLWRTHLRRWVASIPDELPWALAILTAAAAAGYVLGYRDGAQAR